MCSRQGLVLQAEKTQDLGEWGGLKVNIKKCAVTGMLYSDARTDLVEAPLQPKAVTCLWNRLASVKISGKQIPFLYPDEPYTYLGVAFTASLNWKHQFQTILENVCKKKATMSSPQCSPQSRS